MQDSAANKTPPNTSNDSEETLSGLEVAEQVKMMARRMALMYHHIAEVLVEDQGKERARELLKEAIWRYGTETGESVRAAVLAMGLPPTIENFSRGSDLPKYGWRTKSVHDNGEWHPTVDYCPLAAVWLDKGSEEMGRIYCDVDQAKFLAYNNLECVHKKNLLDGDDYCIVSVKAKDSE